MQLLGSKVLVTSSTTKNSSNHCCSFCLMPLASLCQQHKICLSSSLPKRQWHPTPVLLPGKSQGWRSLVGCSPWGRYESDTTERLHFDFSLSCIGEGNGNPLQCSCLENPRDRGAWWAASLGSQSRTRLKRLSSSTCYVYLFYPSPIPTPVSGSSFSLLLAHFKSSLLFWSPN